MRFTKLQTLLVASSCFVASGGIEVGFKQTGCLLAQDASNEDSANSAEEKRQKQIVERFQMLLEKTPRRGTALDRVYGHHIEYGTLENFIDQLKKKTQAEPEKGSNWQLLGLFESQRGNEAEAITAFEKASSLNPGDPLPSYYRGQVLLLSGQPDLAVKAFEEALARKPDRADLIEIFQQLGRVHQRAQRKKEALDVWRRLEELFPNDARVLEQIATTLAEEGDDPEALKKYQQLVRLVKDDYRKTTFRIQIGELRVRLGKKTEGLTEFETLLSDLNPESWLYHDVRRRIENVYLKSGDQDGLVSYYEDWLKKNPEDLEAMARLAKHLAGAARVPEATQWLETALKKAPTRTQLRKAFIEQLVDRQEFSEAAAQYQLLAAAAPGNIDVLRDWGRIVLRDRKLPEEKRKAEASRIWKKILEARPNDSVTIAQVADYFRHAKMDDEALELYRKAVEQSPNDPQYREYLGEYLHVLNRPEEALKTWEEIASGNRENALNVTRLAEVLSQFGYHEPALDKFSRAIELDTKDISLQLKAARAFTQAKQYQKALDCVDAAEKLAANADEKETAFKERISVLQANETLSSEINKLTETLKSQPDASSDEWLRLARYQEADRNNLAASEAIEAALKKDQQSIPIVAAAARIAESTGDLGKAVKLLNQLTTLDRRERGEHLMAIARLELQQGRSEEALKAAKELIISAPGETDHYEFYAQICFQLGKPEEGLDALRKAFRIAPNEPHLVTVLAMALADQFKTTEAIEVYWKAFDKSDEIEDQLTLITKITELAVQLNQFERVTERLKRERRSDEKRRNMTLTLAQAYHTIGDTQSARVELESLLTPETRDTKLLQQLSKLCEEEEDFVSAVQYQRQLVAIAPVAETEFRLAQLYTKSGNDQGAQEILIRLTQKEEDPARFLRSVDAMITQNSTEAAHAVIESALRERPNDWELLYREGVLLEKAGKQTEAQTRFQQILNLDLPDETRGVFEEQRYQSALKNAKSSQVQTQLPQQYAYQFQAFTQYQNEYQIRAATGLENNVRFGSGGSPSFWAPPTYGQARAVCFGWQLKFARFEQKEESFLNRFESAALEETPRKHAEQDWLLLSRLSDQNGKGYEISRRIAERGGVREKTLFLTQLQQLRMNASAVWGASGGANSKPLSDEDIDFVLKCFREVINSSKAESPATNNQLPNFFASPLHLAHLFQSILPELKLAGRQADIDTLLNEIISEYDTEQELAIGLALVMASDGFDKFLMLLDRYEQALKSEESKSKQIAAPAIIPPEYARQMILEASKRRMGKLAAEHQDEEERRLFARLASIFIESLLKEKANQPATQNSATQGTRTAKSVQRRQVSSANMNWASVWYGDKQQGARFNTTLSSEYLDSGLQQLLVQLSVNATKNETLSEVEPLLRSLRDQAQLTTKPYYTSLLVHHLWSIDQKDEAIDLFRSEFAGSSKDTNLELQLAELLQLQKRDEEALKIVTNIISTDPAIRQRKELLTLTLAESLGDNDLARTAAENLFGMRLDIDSQLSLIPQLQRLGMNDQAQAIAIRSQKQAGNRIDAIVNLMTMAHARGDVELANRMALSVLQRTSATTGQTASRIFSGYQTSNNGHRNQALRLLHQTGALTLQIEKLEQQLKTSPESNKLYQQLIEYAEASNDKVKVKEVFERAIKQKSGTDEIKAQYAKVLSENGQSKEACDLLIPLFKAHPEWFTNDFYQVHNIFSKAQRNKELVTEILKMHLKHFREPWPLIQIANDLLQQAESRETGAQFAKKVIDAFPQSADNLVQNIHQDEFWETDIGYELGLKALLPPAGQKDIAPWFGFSQLNSYGPEGRPDSFFDKLSKAVKSSKRAADFLTKIEDRLKENGDWKAGHAMLALTELKTGKRDQGTKKLAAIFDSDKAIEQVHPNAAWIIGVQLMETASTQPLAEKLLIRASRSDEISMSAFQFRPEAALIRLYQTTGDKHKARELLLKRIPSGNHSSDAGYEAYQQLQDGRYVAEKLNTLGLHFDALKYATEMSNNEALFEQASRVFGNPQQAELSREEIKQAGDTAIRLLMKATVSQELDAVLPLVDVAQKAPYQLDLIFAVKKESGSGPQALKAVLYSVLQEWSKTDGNRQLIQKRLDAIQQAVPENLAVQSLRLRFALDVTNETVAAPLQEELNAYLAKVSKNPLEEIPANRKPNQSQIKQAEQLLPVWLVAESCLKRPSLSEVGTELSEVAFAAAKRLDNQGPANAIIQTRLQIASNQPDQTQIQRVAEFALESIVGPASTSNRVAPLKMSQFSACVDIARRCAEAGFKELSLKAVQQAMAGGLPLPDQVQAEGSNQSLIQIARPTSNAHAPGENLLSLVSRDLLGILTLWESRQYPAADIEALLRAMVFPESRTADIMLFPGGEPQFGEAPDSLGSRLVHWSAKAGTLDSLKEKAVARKQAGPKGIPALVLLTLIDIERDDLPSTRKHLAEISSLKHVGSAEEDLLSLAVYPAFKHRELTKEVASLAAQTQLLTLQRQAEQTEANSASPFSRNPGAILRVLKLLQEADKHEELVQYVEGLVTARQKTYSRFGGGYGVYLQMNDNARIADALAGVGEIPTALDFLGRVVDYDYTEFGRPTIQTSLVSLALSLQKKTAEEQEKTWREWTLPAKARRSYRFIAQIILPENVPDRVIESGGIASPKAYRDIESKTFIDNFSLLISAAKDCNKLDELKNEVQSSLTNGGLNAQFLWMMILAEKGDEKTLAPLLKKELERVKTSALSGQNRHANTNHQSLALLLKLREKNILKADAEAYAAQIGTRLHLWFENTYGTELRVNLAKKQRLERGGSEVVPVPQFKNWIDATQPLSAERQATMPRWWGVQGIDLYQVISPIYSHLILKTPLNGNWSCEFDITMGSSEELGIGFDGCRLNLSSGAVHQIQSTTRHEELKSFNFGVSGNYAPIHLRIDSIDGVLKYYVNGSLAAEQTIRHSSPWLDMKFGRNGMIKVSDPRFQVKPQVQETVPLFSNDRMDYWDGSFFSNQLVQHRAIEGESQGMTPADLRVGFKTRIVRPGSADWEVVDGVLFGRSRTHAKPQAGARSSNRSSERFIAYHRPIQEGDRIEYEFWYEAGFSEVHPVVGRMAFLLGENGVQLHWLAKANWDTSVLGIDQDNRIEDPNLEQVAATLQLKNGDWNKAVLEVEGDSITLSVNETVAFRRPRDHATLEQFGLYHRSQTEAKVRNATLTGTWRKEFNDATDVSWSTLSPVSPEENFQLIQQVPAAFASQDFMSSILKARELSGDQAYTQLKNWVFLETRPQLIRGGSRRAPIGSSASKLMTDSELLSPLWELVKAADAANKLDELTSVIAQIPDEATTRDDLESLEMLIALRQKRFDEVNTYLNGLADQLKKNPPKKGETTSLSPAYIVAWYAAESAETRNASVNFTTEQRNADRIRALHSSEVERKHRSLAHHVTLQTLKQDHTATTAFKQWTTAYQPSRNTRMTGTIPGTWVRQDGMVSLIPDETVSRLMFNIPLQGNFEIESLRSTHGYKELNIIYCGFSADPRWDRKALKLGEFGKQREVAGALDIPDYKAFANYRIVVNPQSITTFINGVKIHEQKYDQQVDPWLMLAPLTAGYQPQIKSLKITGKPVIPDSLELFKGKAKEVWKETYFNNSINRNGSSSQQRSSADWTFVGDELNGETATGKSGDSPGYLWYHRPMLEDGEFTFESFYVPGEKEISPVVGKQVFLLKSDGLTLKPLIDPEIAIKPRTETSETKLERVSEALPLKPDEWNQIKVTVKGDIATVTLNGKVIGSTTLTDRPDQRYIGLYRNLTQSGCQIRNMVYRGEWPKSLPPVDQQEFANLGTPEK